MRAGGCVAAARGRKGGRRGGRGEDKGKRKGRAGGLVNGKLEGNVMQGAQHAVFPVRGRVPVPRGLSVDTLTALLYPPAALCPLAGPLLLVGGDAPLPLPASMLLVLAAALAPRSGAAEESDVVVLTAKTFEHDTQAQPRSCRAERQS